MPHTDDLGWERSCVDFLRLSLEWLEHRRRRTIRIHSVTLEETGSGAVIVVTWTPRRGDPARTKRYAIDPESKAYSIADPIWLEVLES